MEQLQKVGIIDTQCSEAENHLSRQRIRVSSNMSYELTWLLEKSVEHHFVLQVLIRYV